VDNQIINSIKNTLQIEANAIAEVVNNITDDMVNAVKHLYECKGRVIITGIGKSAIIGQKIVATLNSTGTQAIFLHAADAIHGDLGLIHQDDTVICISKSGDTEELKVLLPYIKMRGNKIISMVSNAQSYLANHSDYCIYLPISHEADPNNLAPTASTAVQLAMGDAIAVALLNLKGFTPQHFAQLHPGGSLGKVLYTKVKDISYKNAKPSVSPDEVINNIIITITSSRLGATAVIDENDALQGIITDGDLRRMLQHKEYSKELRASEIMSVQPKTIEADALAIDAMRKMQEMSVSQLIVLDQGTYAGIIHIHDLIREGIV
jgi:arabinose-5-phosphate isomerase